MAIVLAAINVLAPIFSTVMSIIVWLSFERSIERSYYDVPHGGVPYQSDYGELIASLVPAVICIAAAILLVIAVVRSKASYAVISASWLVLAVSTLIMTISFLPDDSMLLGNYIISTVCFTLIGIFILLWSKNRKDSFLGMAAAAGAVVIVFQMILVLYVGISEVFWLVLAFPWFPTVPLIPASVTALTVLSEKRSEAQ